MAAAYVNDKDMQSFVRMLLWTAVVVAPGGILLAPVLIAHELRNRQKV